MNRSKSNSMVYTAHTKETIPVLREKAPDKPKSYTGHPDNNYAIDQYIKQLKEYENYLLNLKEIPIAPEYKDYWKDGQEVDESEFEIVKIYRYTDELAWFNVAIPKQKEETQEEMWEEIYDVFHSDVFGSDAIKKLQSKIELKRK